ncbi:hypothetical protein BDW02DRAFT_474587, partial [Decorospora gaudefroyi]
MPHHRLLPYTTTLLSTIYLSLGATYMFNPRAGFSLFGFSHSPSGAEWPLLSHIMVLYGAKDVFMGLAILVSMCCGTRTCTGLVLLGAAA